MKTTILLFVIISILSIPVLADTIHPSKETIKNSVVNSGDFTRLWHVMKKAKDGEEITIATIGGSITVGAAVSKDKRWATQAAKWWQDKFPNTKINFINAGIGATASDMGAHRAYNDMLKYKPDVIIVEFTVNDNVNQYPKETYEGLIRQCLAMKNQPAVISLMTMDSWCNNMQDIHMDVVKYYNLPTASFKNAFMPEITTGKILDIKETLMPDGVHPNEYGHQSLADFITVNFFDKAYKTIPKNIDTIQIPTLKKPLISDTYQYTKLYNANYLKPIINTGWNIKKTDDLTSTFGASWVTDTPGSKLKFELEGDTISLIYFRSPQNMGMLEVTLDNQKPVILDCCFANGWGDYWALNTLARGLNKGKHTVEIKLLSEKNPASNGYKAEIIAILEAGK